CPANPRRLLHASGGPKLLFRGRPAAVRALRQSAGMVSQSDFECGWLRKIFQRPNNCRICRRHLGCKGVPYFLLANCEGGSRHMPISSLAGNPAPRELLIDPSRLEREYYQRRPDLGNKNQLVSFGSSGHRGSPLNGSFTEVHILAITQAICDYRRSQGYDGPLYMGKDTHAVSGPAQCTALEVLAGNNVETIIQIDDGFTPTPVISRAILVYNRNRKEHVADGIVITPSHNPPADGGFKYNPPNGGPADTDVTRWVEHRANELLRDGSGIKRVPFTAAIKADTTHQEDFVLPYVEDLRNVID